jgi:hypothetical protein
VPERWRGFPFHLGLVTVGALVLRLVYAVGVKGNEEPGGDGFYFHNQAVAISQGDGFINPIAWLYADTNVQAAHHPPLYSVFLAVPSFLGLDSPLAHRVVSCVAGAVTVALVGLLARRLAGGPGAGDRAGLLAAGLAAIYPILWVNDGLILSEPLYGVMIVLVLFAAYRVYDDPGPRNAALLGGAIALAALTRAEASNLLLFLALPLALLLPALNWKRRATLVLAAGLAYGVVVSPWILYNLARFDQPVFLSYGAAGVLPQANCDQTYDGPLLGYWSGGCAFPSAKEIPELNKPRPDIEVVAQEGIEFLGDGDESDAADIGLHRGLDYIKSRPGRAAVVSAARVGRLWGLYRPAQGIDLDTVVEDRGRGISTVGLILYYELLALGIVGLVVLRRRKVPILPFLSLAVLVTFTAAVAIGITRYRFPVDVGLVVLGGIALDAGWRWVRRPSPSRRATASSGSKQDRKPTAEVGAAS